MMRFSFLFLLLTIVFSCSERDRNNPFDPSGDIPVNIWARAIDKSVEVSWSSPDIVDYTGFNLYRNNEGSTAFSRITTLGRFSRSFTDTTVNFGSTYTYYVRVASGNLESQPSKPVSVTPGKGFNWIVDETSFQIRKLSYDLAYTFLAIDTYPGMPTDMAISNQLNRGLILYNRFQISGFICKTQEYNLLGQ